MIRYVRKPMAYRNSSSAESEDEAIDYRFRNQNDYPKVNRPRKNYW